MNRLRPLALVAVLLVLGCSWKPGTFSQNRGPFMYPNGVSMDLWDRCVEWALNHVKQQPEVLELSEAELDCLLSMLMDKCISIEIGLKSAQGIQTMTDKAGLFLELQRRRSYYCGSGGQNASSEVLKILDETTFGEVSNQLVCPPVLQ